MKRVRSHRIRDSLYPTFRGPQRADDVATPCSSKLQALWQIAPGTFNQTNKQQEPELKLTKPESNTATKAWRKRVHWPPGPSRPQKLYVAVEWAGEGMGAVLVSTCVSVGGHCAAVCVLSNGQYALRGMCKLGLWKA